MTVLLSSPPITDATRRQFIGGAALATLLAGCSSADPAAPGDPAGDGAFPLTVDHVFGTTTVPAEPTRLVTVGLNDQDVVYALGSKPVASTYWFEEVVVYPWSAAAAAGETPEVLSQIDLDLEAVAAARPDLILATFLTLTQSQYEQLSTLAPTVAAPAGFGQGEAPWQEQTRLIGRALGREAQAEELVRGTEELFTQIAARHPEWAGASAVLASQYIDGQLLVYPAGTAATNFLERLGFVVSAQLEEFSSDTYGVPALSAERLDLIDVDLVVWDTPPDALEAAGFFALPTYGILDAVREGRVLFPAEEVQAALSFRTVTSLAWALERLEPQLVAAFDGDPATMP